MIFLIHFIHNAATIYSWVLVAFALLSWFPNAYDTALGRLLTSLVKPILQPLRRLPLRVGVFDLTVWVAVILVHLVGNYLIRFLLILA